MQKIEVDWEKRVVRLGDLYLLHQYVNNIGYPWVARNVCKLPVYARSSGKAPCGTKEKNKQMTELLGVSPSKFAKMIKGAQYSLWIKGKEDLIYKYGIRNKCRIPLILDAITKHIDVIRQYQEDGLDNLVPLAICFGKSTKELKTIFGKGLWKKICSTCETRNKHIMGICVNSYFTLNHKRQIDIVKRLFEMSSTTLKKGSLRLNRTYIFMDSYVWADAQLKANKELQQDRLFTDYCRLYRDTKTMADQVGESFNPGWSRSKMLKKHREFTDLFMLRKYSKEPFVFNCFVEPVIEKDNLRAVLIDSPYKLHLQGADQGHCVASYLQSIKSGKYLVYDIQEDGKTKSTLGISIKYNSDMNFTNFEYDQHYAKYNERPEEHISDFSKFVLRKLYSNVYKDINFANVI
jgi:hypothetical protein